MSRLPSLSIASGKRCFFLEMLLSKSSEPAQMHIHDAVFHVL